MHHTHTHTDTFLAGLQQKATTAAVPVFSTAVISGSTSAPDLRDNFSALPFSANLEGLGGVPSIRPLETLHNALSLRQLDAFLERMALAQFRTPLSSPPKMPSTPRHPRTQPLPLGLQSPSSSVGWSGPPSFVSSSGPSSPNITTLEFFSHQHRCYDTNTSQPASPKLFSTALPLTTTTQFEHTHHNPYTTKAPATYADTFAADNRAYAEVDAAAVRLLQLTTSTKPQPDLRLPGFTTEHSSVAELSTAEGGMVTIDNSGETSDPASPSEGSESLGSHSQTEVASIIERGDTATPDTHSDVQDQEISCQDNTEPENLLSVTNNRSATSE